MGEIYELVGPNLWYTARTSRFNSAMDSSFREAK